MPTATRQKATAPSSELRKLQTKRDKAHAEYHEVRAKLDAWDTEGAPELRPGSAQAEQHAAQRERENGPNPHREEYDLARATYYESDTALQTFKRERVLDRIAEVTGDVDADAIRADWERLRRGLEHYRVEVEEVRGIVLDTPGLTGQALDHDGRVESWYGLAVEALAGAEMTKPGLTPAAIEKVAQHG